MSPTFDDKHDDRETNEPDDWPDEPLPKRNFRYQLATMFSIGYFWPGPMMVTAAFSTLTGGFIMYYLGINALFAAIIIGYFVGVWAAKGHELTVFHHDARAVVIDEVIGLWITMIPLYWYSPTGLVFIDFIMAFMVFRLLDIIKPYPARQLHDKLPGGWGVMSDDVFSGAYGSHLLSTFPWD